MIDFSRFEEKCGIVFTDKNLLQQAFIHRSFLNENTGLQVSHNERLEFLGDAVLELSVTDYLYKKYPDYAEGDLTAYRSSLVNAVIIAEVAGEVGMNDFLLLSKGEAKDTGKARMYILANTYEAFVGAVYLDRGFDIADEFIKTSLLPKLEDIVAKKSWRDAKSHIQEKAQEHVGVTPSYKVIQEAGPDHDKHFTVGIYFADQLIAQGKGKSKQEAEQKSAQEALRVKGWED